MPYDVMTPDKPTKPDEKELQIRRAVLLTKMQSELKQADPMARKVAIVLLLSKVPKDVRAQGKARLQGDKPAPATSGATGDAPNSQAGVGGAARRRSVYLVGHGMFVLTNGMFKVPENTTVRFYTIAGRKMASWDASDIVSGALNPRTEQVFEAGESCPNMTLQSERDDPPLRENATAGEKAAWKSAALLKQRNEDNAKAARARGDDLLQVDKDATLESIVLAKPGFDYAWTCCYDYGLKGLDGPKTPVGGLGIGGFHGLSDGGNKLNSKTFERVGDAGGWYEARPRRSVWDNLIGRIETVEVLESGKAVALQLLLTDETKISGNKFKSYTVFVKTDILQKNTYFSSLPPETFRELAAGGFDTLQRKKLTIDRAKIFDKAQRSLQLEKPGDFKISD